MEQEMKSFIDSFNKDFRDTPITNHKTKIENSLTKIHSGSFNLDDILGGGMPLGRIIEMYGQESCGKTSLALSIVSEAQKQGIECAYIDMEQALNLEFAKVLGVDLDKLHTVQPDYGEQGIEMLHKIVESGLFKVVVLDSVATLTPKKEIEGEVGDAVMGVQAKLMSQLLRKINPVVRKNNVLLIFINQLRSNLSGYGSSNITTGGKGLKFYATIRLDMARVGLLKNGEDIIGQQIKIKTSKNKIHPPFKTTTISFLYDRGISTEDEIIEQALKQKIMTKKGAWYYYQDVTLGQGLSKTRELLLDNIELREEIVNKIKNNG